MVGGFPSVSRRLSRFRIRTLLLIPVLIAAYFAMESPTRRMGVRDVSRRLSGKNDGNELFAKYQAPLLLASSIVELHHQSGKPDQIVFETDYYFWFFGVTAKLPYRGKFVQNIVETASDSAPK
jgi:hypothetical protein